MGNSLFYPSVLKRLPVRYLNRVFYRPLNEESTLNGEWKRKDLIQGLKKMSPVLVNHSCNPSYSGGRDQENLSSKPPWANTLQDPISGKAHHKKSGGW
jgi:hypothetical protein